MKTLKELIEQRSKLIASMESLLEAPEGGGDFTKEQRSQYEGFEKDLDKLDGQIAIAQKAQERRTAQDELERRNKQPHTAPVTTDLQGQHSDGEKRDIERFSFGRMIQSLAEGRSLDGVEGEMVSEGQREARACGISPKGHMVPSFVCLSEKRSMTATGGTDLNQGGMTIELEKAPLLDSLFNRTVLGNPANGATMLTGLVGNIDLPRVIPGTDPGNKAENAGSDEVKPTTDQLGLSPKRLPTFIDASNQLIMQSSTPSIDMFLINHLSRRLAAIMENNYFNGNGGVNPVGILNTTGIGVVEIGTDGGAIEWDDVVALETAVGTENADIGRLHYITNAAVKGVLKTTTRATDGSGNPVDSMFIYDPMRSNELNSYVPLFTNSVPSNLTKGGGTNLSALIFGNLEDFIVANWSGIEILVNPFSRDTEGMTRINAAVYYDGGVVRPESFAVCKDITTA